MANNPITVPLPQDLPETWAANQIVSPDGVSAGLTPQHGYNYLMQQVNNAQAAAEQVGAAIPQLADTDLSNLNTPQLALTNLGAGVRSNGVLNPLALVNQVGQTSYSNQTGSTEYAFDGRKGVLYDVSIQDGVESVQISGSATSTARYGAIVPNGLKAGKTYIASVFIKVNSATGSPYFMVSNNLTTVAYTIPLTQGDNYEVKTISFTATDDADSVLLEIIAGNGSSLSADIKGWKIEEGKNQTLVYQDDESNLQMISQQDMKIGLQLAECQRYQVVYSMVQSGLYFMGLARSTTLCTIMITTPVPLRVNPSVEADCSALELFDGVNEYAISSISFYTMSQNQVALSVESAGLTQGGVYLIRAKNATQMLLNSNI